MTIASIRHLRLTPDLCILPPIAQALLALRSRAGVAVGAGAGQDAGRPRGRLLTIVNSRAGVASVAVRTW